MINHCITIRKRRISVDDPRLIRGCRGVDSITLKMDDEWSGLDEITVSIGSGRYRQEARYDGSPMILELVDFPTGYIPVYVFGRTADGRRSICTIPAPYVFRVTENGRS